MNHPIQSPVPSEAIATAVDHALGLGLLMTRPDGRLTHAPFTLRPTPFPRDAFREAQRLARDFNTLMARVAADNGFLDAIGTLVARHDPFTAELFRIHRTVRAEGPRQTAALGLFRSDYLIHHPAGATRPALRQVEINAIASSFGALGSRVSALHRFLLADRGLSPSDLPPNPALDRLAAGLAAAARYYGRPGSVVCFLIQPGERNRFDQRLLEYRLGRDHGIRTVRLGLRDIAAGASLKGPRRRLVLDADQREIGLVYFRAGYTPDDYPGPDEWEGRLRIERSAAIKCPDIATHLSGMKKVQQTLAMPATAPDSESTLARFLPDAFQRRRVAACFADFHSLDDPGIANRVRAAPDEFVLKPQREGGGNNLYDQEMMHTLAQLTSDQRNAWVLMQRIHPPRARNVLIRDGVAKDEAETIAELGIFSVHFRDADRTLIDESAGHLLRTKPAGHAEGGVAAGFSVLDSPILVMNREPGGD